MTPSESPYLAGNYAPILTEIDAPDLASKGAIPRDLEGMFVRNGANPRYAPRGRHHWFDGDAMLHGVHLAGGRASYRNRWVRTSAFVAEEQAGGPLWGGVTERPDFTNPRGPFKDTSNTNLVFHAGRLLTLWWLGGEAYVVDVPSLATCGTETWGGKVKTVSAHPKVCAGDGGDDVLRLQALSPRTSPTESSRPAARSPTSPPSICRARASSTTWPSRRGTPSSSTCRCAGTRSSSPRARRGCGFFRDEPTRFGILPRHAEGSAIRWFEASPCYMYHTINAWEDGDRIVLVGCKIDNPLAGDPGNPVGGVEVPTIGFLRLEPRLHRWTFNLVTGAVKEERLDDTLGEFPRIDGRRLGRRSRYSYNPRLAPAPTLLFNAVTKYDLDTGRSSVHRYPAGRYGGEVVFAPRTGGAAEDDGYLLTFVADEQSGESELYVLDAAHVAEEPVARLRIPQRVPTGYHAWWIPGDQLPRS